MISGVTQFLHSRYDSDLSGSNANEARLNNFKDIFAQLGRGLASSVVSSILIPGRVGAGLVGVVATPAVAVVNTVQFLFFKNGKTAAEIYKPAKKLFVLSGVNISTFRTSIPVLLVDAGWRTVLIGSDILGLAAPQIGQTMRLKENRYVDNLNQDINEIDLFWNSSSHKKMTKLLDRVWPRADKINWSLTVKISRVN